jgi:hypothetical protein
VLPCSDQLFDIQVIRVESLQFGISSGVAHVIRLIIRIVHFVSIVFVESVPAMRAAHATA